MGFTLFQAILLLKLCVYTECMTLYQQEFIENLKYYRMKKNISQSKLAELCNCGTGTIGCIECGRQFPSFDMLFTIANVLEIHPGDLFIRNASVLQESLLTFIKNDIPNVISKFAEEKFGDNIKEI